jgi:hypothetical protein
MAEANAEMLEEQLRRPAPQQQAPSTQGSMRPPPSRPIGSGTPSTPAVRPVLNVTPSNARPTPGIAPGRHSTGDRERPQSLYLPNQTPGMSHSAHPSSAEPSKSVFGFWNGGKKKLPAGLGTLNIPTPAQVLASLPGTPADQQKVFDWVSSPGSGGEARSPAARSMSLMSVLPGEPPGLSRSMSSSTINMISPPSRPPVPSGNNELMRLRTAFASSQSSLKAMSTELAELKKGKVEMEAELENLSQALFEEANKMVAEERRKRAEVEEGLKEVREEKEALKKVIRVLGGQAEEAEGEGGNEDGLGGEKGAMPARKASEAKSEDFQPRDLDKHYQALRETIHHVSDSHPSSPVPQPEPSVADSILTPPSIHLSAPSITSLLGLGFPSTPSTTEPSARSVLPTPLPVLSPLMDEAPKGALPTPAEINPWATGESISPNVELSKAGEGELPVADVGGLEAGTPTLGISRSASRTSTRSPSLNSGKEQAQAAMERARAMSAEAEEMRRVLGSTPGDLGGR